MTDLLTGFGPALADVIANGAWMAVVIAALAWTVLRLMPIFKPVNAATRHAVWVGSLILILAVHVGLGIQHLPAYQSAFAS